MLTIISCLLRMVFSGVTTIHLVTTARFAQAVLVLAKFAS